jgi:uncharacterized membrane protein YgcG
MNKKELWLKIANYHFDNLVSTQLWDVIVARFGGQNPFTKAFADKLSRKLNWKKSFALKAIWEYKKFVYLGVISDFSVTPSKIIDQVWHEHLLFSAGYRKFCREIIRYNFDHNPELVSFGIQTEAFKSQYWHTIELYKKEFGIDPPAAIWETTKFKGKIGEIEKVRKSGIGSGNSNDYYGEGSLISMFPSAEISHVESGGGEFGGGGGGGSWDNSADTSDGSSGDSSDSGSSCSSGCGGGCGGD